MTIALWCVLIAGLLPYVAFSFVRGVDPRLPRAGAANLAGLSARAYGAHLNGLETYPFFAAAVIVAHMVAGPSRVTDILAVVYILVRIAHMVAYLADRQPVRSAMWGVGLMIAAAIFVLPAFH